MFATEAPINLETLLDGMAYPIATVEILDYAQDQDASEEALELLRGLPDREFDSLAEINRHLGRLAVLPGNENMWAGEGQDTSTL